MNALTVSQPMEYMPIIKYDYIRCNITTRQSQAAGSFMRYAYHVSIRIKLNSADF